MNKTVLVLLVLVVAAAEGRARGSKLDSRKSRQSLWGRPRQDPNQTPAYTQPPVDSYNPQPQVGGYNPQPQVGGYNPQPQVGGSPQTQGSPAPAAPLTPTPVSQGGYPASGGQQTGAYQPAPSQSGYQVGPPDLTQVPVIVSGIPPISPSICKYPGFFPTPGSCVNFYRCVDWTGTGTYYSVFQFNCPAGTIFDDELDICNHIAWAVPKRPECTDMLQGSLVPLGSGPPPPGPVSGIPAGTYPPLVTPAPTTYPGLVAPIAQPGSVAPTALPGSVAPTSQPGSVAPTTQPGSVAPTAQPGSVAPTAQPGSGYPQPGGATVPGTGPPSGSPGGATVPGTGPPSGSPGGATVPGTGPPSGSPGGATVPGTGPPSGSPGDHPPRPFALECYADGAYRRHPLYCNRYYRCAWDGQDWVFPMLTCPEGLIFNDAAQQCADPASIAPCDGQLAPYTAPEPTVTEMPTESPITEAPTGQQGPAVSPDSLYDCPATGYYPFEGDCIRFYKCVELDAGTLKGLLYKCPDGFGYSEEKKRCDKNERLPTCTKTAVPAHIRVDTATILYPDDLAWFFNN